MEKDKITLQNNIKSVTDLKERSFKEALSLLEDGKSAIGPEIMTLLKQFEACCRKLDDLKGNEAPSPKKSSVVSYPGT